MLPAWCNIYLDVRLAPKQSIQSSIREIENKLEGLKRKDPELNYSLEWYRAIDGTETSRDSYIVRTGLGAWEKNFRKRHPAQVDPSLTTYGDDGNICRFHNIPTITLLV